VVPVPPVIFDTVLLEILIICVVEVLYSIPSNAVVPASVTLETVFPVMVAVPPDGEPKL